MSEGAEDAKPVSVDAGVYETQWLDGTAAWFERNIPLIGADQFPRTTANLEAVVLRPYGDRWVVAKRETRAVAGRAIQRVSMIKLKAQELPRYLGAAYRALGGGPLGRVVLEPDTTGEHLASALDIVLGFLAASPRGSERRVVAFTRETTFEERLAVAAVHVAHLGAEGPIAVFAEYPTKERQFVAAADWDVILAPAPSRANVEPACDLVKPHTGKVRDIDLAVLERPEILFALFDDYARRSGTWSYRLRLPIHRLDPVDMMPGEWASRRETLDAGLRAGDKRREAAALKTVRKLSERADADEGLVADRLAALLAIDVGPDGVDLRLPTAEGFLDLDATKLAKLKTLCGAAHAGDASRGGTA